MHLSFSASSLVLGQESVSHFIRVHRRAIGNFSRSRGNLHVKFIPLRKSSALWLWEFSFKNIFMLHHFLCEDWTRFPLVSLLCLPSRFYIACSERWCEVLCRYTENMNCNFVAKKLWYLNLVNYFYSDRFPYYKSNDDRWKNSVRHNLSINPHFRKGNKAKAGAGHLWKISSRESEANFLAWEHVRNLLSRFNQFL